MANQVAEDGGGGQGSATIRVKVFMAGQQAKMVDLPKGATVTDAAKAAGFDYARKDLRVGNDVVPTDHVLKDGDLVGVTPRVEAGDK